MMEILAANELLSGGAVYLDATGRWVEELQQARLFGKDEAEARDALIAASKATGRIVSIEIETVAVTDGVLIPDRLRERIRAGGPTTPLFEKQHLGEDGHVSV
jgi:hypothetical protein